MVAAAVSTAAHKCQQEKQEKYSSAPKGPGKRQTLVSTQAFFQAATLEAISQLHTTLARLARCTSLNQLTAVTLVGGQAEAATIWLAKATMETWLGLAICWLTRSIGALALGYWLFTQWALKVCWACTAVSSGEQGSAGGPIETRLATTSIHQVAGEVDVGQST